MRDRVTCISTPGQDVDVLVTQAGVAVNPKNTELRERLRAAGLPVVDIHELKSAPSASQVFLHRFRHRTGWSQG